MDLQQCIPESRGRGRFPWAAVRRPLRVLLAMSLLAALFGATARPVRAANVETLLMPGKVTQAHIKQEETCSNCHDRSNVRAQSSLCLDCHKDIAEDVRQHLRYHGRMTNAGVGECKACHTEHSGR